MFVVVLPTVFGCFRCIFFLFVGVYLPFELLKCVRSAASWPLGNRRLCGALISAAFDSQKTIRECIVDCAYGANHLFLLSSFLHFIFNIVMPLVVVTVLCWWHRRLVYWYPTHWYPQ